MRKLIVELNLNSWILNLNIKQVRELEDECFYAFLNQSVREESQEKGDYPNCRLV